MSEHKITDPIRDASDPRWAELQNWIETQPLSTFRGGDLPIIENMTPVERGDWWNQNCRPPFSTPCPDWCQVKGEHSDDLTRAGYPMTSHNDDGFTVGDYQVMLVREDVDRDGAIQSETKIMMFGSDGSKIDVPGLLAWADALRLAAAKYEPLVSVQ